MSSTFQSCCPVIGEHMAEGSETWLGAWVQRPALHVFHIRPGSGSRGCYMKHSGVATAVGCGELLSSTVLQLTTFGLSHGNSWCS